VRYRVYYGLSPNELVEAVDTFTSEPSWYVYNLVNGSEYYFAVVAVDSKGISVKTLVILLLAYQILLWLMFCRLEFITAPRVLRL
jgi:hypothetical protein